MNYSILKQLNKIYTGVVNSSISNFYHELYGEQGPKLIDSMETWIKLPILTREKLQSKHLWERVCTSKEKVFSIRMTSGTSGRGVLFSPKSYVDDYDKLIERFNSPNGIIFFLQNPHMQFISLEHAKRKIPVLCGDYQHIRKSLLMATDLRMDCIYCFPFALAAITPIAKEIDLNKRLRSLILTGECLSDYEIDLIKKDYPNTRIINVYGFTEFSTHVGVSPLTESGFNIVNPIPPHFWEIIDDKGEVCTKPGQEGRIILTTLPTVNLAMPMLRYDTGDLARVKKWSENHFECEFELLGRKDIDSLRLLGGILKVEEIERVLKIIDPSLIRLYQFHYYNKPTPRLELHLDSDCLKGRNAEALRTRVEKELRLGPSLTYADSVLKGLYERLTIVEIKNNYHTNAKRVRIIKHDTK